MALVQGWSGIAIISEIGAFACKCRSITRRWNTWLTEFVVTKPKRRSTVSLLVSSRAAWSHQYMTKSADLFMSEWAAHSASAHSSPSLARMSLPPIKGGLPTMNSASGHSGGRGLV